jgi:hypothetical protein
VIKEVAMHTVGLAGRNLFWGSSDTLSLGMRVVNISVGRTGFLRQRVIRLGQEAVPNRLLDFQPSIIFYAIPGLLNFALFNEGVIPATKSEVLANLGPWSRKIQTGRTGFRISYLGVEWYRVERLSEDEYAKLAGVLSNPSAEEAADLALMFTFFRSGTYGASAESLCSYRGAFCGEPIVVPAGFELEHWPTHPNFYGLNVDQKWGDIRRAVWNAVVMSRVLTSYPLPSPIPIMTAAWYGRVQPELQAFVASGAVITEDLGRAWTTLITIEKYNDLAAAIYEELKDEGRRDRRKAIIEAVALAATLAVIGYGIGAALSTLIPAGSVVTGGQIAKVVTTVIATELSQREKQDAAQDLEKVATLFQESDAGFAGEVRHTQQFLGLTPEALAQEELDAINAARGERELTTAEAGEHFELSPEAFTGTQVGDILLVGGIAAGAILALTLLR